MTINELAQINMMDEGERIISVLDYFLFLAVLSIWGILVVNVILTIAGYVNYLQKVPAA